MKNLSRLIGALFLLFALVPPVADADTYKVRDCVTPSGIAPNGDLGEPAVFSSNIANSNWNVAQACTNNSMYDGYWGGYQVGVKQRVYNQGNIARWKYTAPTGVGISSVTARVNGLWDYHGWEANYVFHNNGANGYLIQAPNMGVSTLNGQVPNGGYRTNFEMNLKCTDTTCAGMGDWTYYAMMANVELTVTDPDKPIIAYGGTLFDGGTVSGSRTVQAVGFDGGSGVLSVWVWVNGFIPIGNSVAPGTGPGVSCDPGAPTYNSFRPCPNPYDHTWTVNTAQAPFVNGSNAVYVCAKDYTLNVDCRQVNVQVQN